MQVTFSDPIYLWLLLSIPFLLVLHFYSLKYIKVRAIKFANFEALKRVSGGVILSKNIFLLLLRLLTLLFLTLSLAGATWWYTGRIDVSDYVLAIDNSGSMLANDFAPNRLEAAKEAAISFSDNLTAGSRISIVSFSGAGIIELSLTNDKKKIKQKIENIEISRLHGTAVSDALRVSANALYCDGSVKAKTIILLTDGQENIASEQDLSKILGFINNRQITVNTIGVATKSGASFPGLNIKTTLDEGILISIANSTGGKYAHSESKEEIINAYNSFSYELSDSKIPINLRIHLIIITFIVLFIEWVLLNTKYRTIP